MPSSLALLALVVLATVLGLHPATSAAAGAMRLGFISIAPGWLLLGVVRPVDGGGAEGAARSFLTVLLLSLLPVALSTLALVALVGLDIEAAAFAVYALTAFGVALRTLLFWRAGAPASTPLGGAGLRSLAILLAPAILLTLAAAWVLVPVGTRFSYHGALHAGLVAQLTSGVIPPDHLSLANVPLDFYWLFHWLVASLVGLSGLSVLVCAPWTALGSLFVYVGSATLLLRRFLPGPESAWAAPAAAFAGNLFFPVVLAVTWLGAGGPEGLVFWPLDVLKLGIPGGDPRLVTLGAKFLNLNGFPMGLAAWAWLLNALLPARAAECDRDPARSGPISGPAFGVFLALLHAIAFHTTTALAVYPALALAIFATYADRLRGARILDAWRGVAPMAAVFAAALVASAPYLWAITRGSPALAGESAAPAALGFGYDVAGLVGSAAPVVLALGWVVFRMLRSRPGLDRAERFLATATAILVGMALAVGLPDHNEYKILLVAFLPAGTLLFAALGSMRAKAWGRFAFAAGVTLGIATAVVTGYAYASAAIAERADIAGEGAFLSLPRDPQLDAALHWLRERSPKDAVVVTPPVPFGASRVRAVSGRAVFLLDGGIHTRGHPAVAARRAPVARLFSLAAPLAPAVEQIAGMVSRPLFVLLRRGDDPKRYAAVRARLDSGGRWLDPVFESVDVVLYAVRRSGDGA